jgi:heme exporter protein CcmD
MTMVLPSYAAYVWSGYLITAAVLGVTVAVTWMKWRNAKKRLADLKDSETNL